MRQLSKITTAIALVLASSAWLTSTAHAMTATYDGASLHGATGSLTITEAASGEFDVIWSIDFEEFDVAGAQATGHEYLTDFGFRAFSDVTSVDLDQIVWRQPTDGTLIGNGNISNAGCQESSGSGLICMTELDPMVSATAGGVFEAHFTVAGDLMTDEWSFRGNFGPETGWVISESANPIPEPSAALAFACGMGVVAVVGRRRRS